MKIDYSTYTEQELLEALDSIDRKAYPDRVQELEERLAFLKRDFEENIKPTLSEDALFQLKSKEISESAEYSGHAVEYSIIGLAAFVVVFILKDSVGVSIVFAITCVIGAVLTFKSNHKDRSIFDQHHCPLCHGKLNYEKVGAGNRKDWYMHCWKCKKMAKLDYSGLS